MNILQYPHFHKLYAFLRLVESKSEKYWLLIFFKNRFSPKNNVQFFTINFMVDSIESKSANENLGLPPFSKKTCIEKKIESKSEKYWLLIFSKNAFMTKNLVQFWHIDPPIPPISIKIKSKSKYNDNTKNPKKFTGAINE